MSRLHALHRRLDRLEHQHARGGAPPALCRDAVRRWKEDGHLPRTANDRLIEIASRVAALDRFFHHHLFEVPADPRLESWTGDPEDIRRALDQVGAWTPWPDDVERPVPESWLPPPEALHRDRWVIDPRQWLWIFCDDQVAANASGRRSLKSEGLIFRTLFHAIVHDRFADARFFLGAPTADQARSVLWDRIKSMVPSWALRTGRPEGSIYETRMLIVLWNGAWIRCVSGDVPSRIEGRWWDGGGFTEFGDCKPGIFGSKVQPMLGRGGWFAAEGVPEGRNAYWELWQQILDGSIPRSSAHHWWTEEVFHLYRGREAADEMIRTAQSTLSAMEYRREYRASWETFQSRAYYSFDADVNVAPVEHRVIYDPTLPLYFAFDFGVNPGVIVVLQEQPPPTWLREKAAQSGNTVKAPPTGTTVTAVIDEIRIDRGSNTPALLEILIGRYGEHASGDVGLFGDPAGGARSTATSRGSDWDVIREELEKVFGGQLGMYVQKADPGQRARLNAMNGRLRSMDGTVSMIVDRERCPWLIRDLEGAEVDDEGHMVKRSGDPVGHEADALTYYCERAFPTRSGGWSHVSSW